MNGRKPGRPKGAKNKPRPKIIPTVDEVVAHCPRCQSTNRTRKLSQRKHDRVVTGGEGGKYYRVRWSHVTCLDCGQVYVIKARLEQSNAFD